MKKIIILIAILFSLKDIVNAQDIYKMSEKYLPGYTYIQDITGEIQAGSVIDPIAKLKGNFSKKMTYKIVITTITKEGKTIYEETFSGDEIRKIKTIITNKNEKKMKYIVIIGVKIKK